jgi:hypothetical protein
MADRQNISSSPSGNSLKYTNENSLTAPWDKKDNQRPLTTNHPPLSNEEFEKAFDELIIKDFTKGGYRRIERRYLDPPIPNQNIGLFSFIPSRGSRPDSKGVYGFAKLRGVYSTEREADERSEDLVRNQDSYHKIFYINVGRPFPVTLSDKFSASVNEIDIQKQVKAEIAADVKSKREKERKEIEQIQDRAKNLQENVDKEDEDPEDYYTKMRVKKAQLMWTYIETMKKLDIMKESIIKARDEINRMDAEDPHLKEVYLEKYMEARKSAGIKDDEEQLKNSFMLYMVEDKEPDLGF